MPSTSTSRRPARRRTTPAAPPAAPAPSRRPAAPLLSPQMQADLGALGIVLLAGLLAGGYYLPGSTGALGGWFVGFSRLWVGILTAVAPILLCGAAVLLAFDRRRALSPQMALGCSLLLLAILGATHRLVIGPGPLFSSTQERLRMLAGLPHDGVAAATGDGGFIGALVTGILLPLGHGGSLLVLGITAFAALMMVGNWTLRAVAETLHERAGNAARQARSGVATIQQQAAASAARLPDRPILPPWEPRARARKAGEDPDTARKGRQARSEPAPAALPATAAEPAVSDSNGQLLIPGTGKPRPVRATKERRARGPANSGDYILPPLELLDSPEPQPKRPFDSTEANIAILENTLGQFRIEAQVVEVSDGPSVTRYEIRLGEGIRVKKILDLADNIAMSLAALSVRVEAPIPGKAAIGIEVPKKHARIVTLKECLDSNEYRDITSPVGFVLGKDVGNEVRCADLAKMPHLLVAGATNSGKSVCLNVLIASMLFRARPDELKMILIDPKRVELTLFDGIPHLIHPVVKDVKQAAGILRWVIREMDRRYVLFNRASTRNVENYNLKMAEEPEKRLPFLVVVIDELADLMMQQGQEVEQSICRLAQLARATGIHLVVATQRPSVDVITGLIKANIPSRIAFAVTSQIDSRTILDGKGAESLVGRGDMLFKPVDANKPTRLQGAFLRESEVEALVNHLRSQGRPEYVAEAISVDSDSSSITNSPEDVEDDLYEIAATFIVSTGHASTSMIQRRFKIGYTRAARLVDMMEARGILGPLDGAKPRQILVTRDQLDQMFINIRGGLSVDLGGSADDDDDDDDDRADVPDHSTDETENGEESPWVDDEDPVSRPAD